MAAVHNLVATVLIQVGADEPKPIGTIEIPIKLGINEDSDPDGEEILRRIYSVRPKQS